MAQADDGTDFFERSIRPVLVTSCYGCHSAGSGKKRGGLLLDSRQGLLRGGDSGPALVPGKPADSLVLKAIRYGDPDLQMPPDGPLAPEVVRAFATWIAMGAPDPRSGHETVDAAVAPRHWAFSPPPHPPLPPVRRESWVRSPLDRFVLAELEARGLTPSPEADRRTLIRRASFDLIGLPPTAVEIAAFEKDRSPEAFAKVVDRMLASPHYGERWGRHWLDVARYADTRDYAYQTEPRMPFAYTYRDWVIRAFNEDLPYDRFVTQQLAADLLPESREDPSSLAALGFLTVGRKFSGKEPDIVDDRIDVVTRGFLGLGVACARCHDHKYDPIPTRDYYSLYGIFASVTEPSELPEIGPVANEEARASYDGERAALRGQITGFLESRQKRAQETLNRPEEIAAYQRAIAETSGLSRTAADGYLEDRGLSRLVLDRWRMFQGTGDSPTLIPLDDLPKTFSFKGRLFSERDQGELRRMKNRLATLDANHPGAPPRAMVVIEREHPHGAHVFIRGNPNTLGPAVPRQFLSVLAGPHATPFPEDTSGRLQLAQAITASSNPLAARVMANRIWMHHFGRGIVATPSDFGLRGDAPTHPALLDWLARRFVDGGWSMKALHGQIMLSATYRQSSVDRPAARKIDPENRLLWRQVPRRLDFEAMRDALLASSGRLDGTQGGRPVQIATAPFSLRRTVYGQVERSPFPNLYRIFDFPTPDLHAATRAETTVPPQGLFFLNSPFVIDAAAHLARTSGPADRIGTVYQRLFGRAPTFAERVLGRRFVRESTWESYVHALLMTNEFVFVD